MYATIIHCDIPAGVSPAERSQGARTLATALGALPGFVAFVALAADAGAVAVLCICEDASSMAAANRLAAEWHRAHLGAIGASHTALCTGEVIAQKGL
jgi:hypothetical protein